MSTIVVPAQTFKVVYNFGTQPGDPTEPHYPGTISQGRNGSLVTSTPDMSNGAGSTFSMTPQGQVDVLHRFNVSDGQFAMSGVTLATDGYYYGTTIWGGDFGFGTIYKVSPHGEFTTLYSFTGGQDGSYPLTAPVQSIGGYFFGNTISGGGNGTLYKISSDGAFTLLHDFKGSDGSLLYAPLVQAADGNFYGTTYEGGAHGAGTIYRISRWGDFKVVFHFDGNHGAIPYAPLVQGTDGNFYGVAAYGGAYGNGTAFKLKPDGTVIVLHSFTGGTDGLNPLGGLTQATDGNFYGTCSGGGAHGLGVLFRLSSTGVFKALYSFDWPTGVTPQNTLLQHTNGLMYGETAWGGSGSAGVFYSFDMGLAPFVSFLPATTQLGSNVQILGQGFTGTTDVSFNGVPAGFSVLYDTYLVATVPSGATSGYITVTTPTGTLKSNKKFIIMP